jgi:BSD domain
MEVHCHYSKTKGRLILNTNGIVFETYALETMFESTWLEIFKDTYAPETDARSMVRFTLNVDTAKHYIFNLQSKEDSNRIKKYCKQQKTILQQQLQSTTTSSTSSSNNLINIRTELLNNDSKLKQQYSELVESNILTEEEFWSSLNNTYTYQIEDKIQNYTNTALKGNLSILHTDVLYNTTTANSIINIELSSEQKKYIFSMYPAVEAAYNDLVPQQLNETSFWDKYLKSDYFKKVCR